MLQPRRRRFVAIRARMEELRRERGGTGAGSEIVESKPAPFSIKHRPASTDKPLSPVMRRLLSRSAR